MYILVTNGKSYVIFPWLRETACRNYKSEDILFRTEEFYAFLESLNGDYSSIKGLTILSPLEGGYKFIENCNFLEQLYIFDDSGVKIKLKLENLIFLKQMVIHCREFEGKDSIFNLLDNKMKCFEQDIKEDNSKLSKYTLFDAAIKTIEINKNEVDKVRNSPMLTGELIINSKHILTEFELRRRERQIYIKKNRENRCLTRAKIKVLLKKSFSDES